MVRRGLDWRLSLCESDRNRADRRNEPNANLMTCHRNVPFDRPIPIDLRAYILIHHISHVLCRGSSGDQRLQHILVESRAIRAEVADIS
jgi:hypothetical protein